MKAMSNDRCVADYLPLAAYIVPQQMAERGDLWPYSTRAVEGRGGRVKKVSKAFSSMLSKASQGNL